jgi:lysophospholipase L1-like esterase
MNVKDGILLVLASLVLGWVLLKATPQVRLLASIEQTIVDTPKLDTPTILSVKGKTALFIGDSHTANHNNGWQKVLSNKVGFNMINASVLGKTTYWMVNEAVYRLTSEIDYCFVYGGANDMYTSSISPKEAIHNIKGIARICNNLGVKCVILTGFDPVKCTRTSNPRYAYKYAEFQRMLLSEYMEGVKVIDTRVVDRVDCWDGLCHMNPAGHKKVAEKVIKDLHFQKI